LVEKDALQSARAGFLRSDRSRLHAHAACQPCEFSSFPSSLHFTAFL